MHSSVVRCSWTVLVAFALPVVIPADRTASAEGQIPADLASERLRARIEQVALSASFSVEAERVHARIELPRFYERRAFAPAWTEDVEVRLLADSMVAAIERLTAEGLEPSDYHLAALRSLRDRLREGAELTPAEQVRLRSGEESERILLLRRRLRVTGDLLAEVDFERMKIRVFTGWGADARELDPLGIDWAGVSAARFPYRLRQDPGAENALGALKFMFPNPFNVYLHDTPAGDLFTRTERAFSSGCIRIEHALGLAERLLRDDPAWSRARDERLSHALLQPCDRKCALQPSRLGRSRGHLHRRESARWLYG